LNITAKIGELLPQFQEVVELFGDKEQIAATMGLFFRDILDFYLIALKFFKLRSMSPRPVVALMTRLIAQ
jgi:hypothetical protein